MIGIYKITNKINNKSYIGQSIHVEERWKEHIEKNNNKSLIHLAIIKYGVENFSFEILEQCSQQELNDREIYWIDKYDTYQNGYNLTLGGESGRKYDVNEILETFNKTQSLFKTANIIGCHITTVRNVCRGLGINLSYLQEAKPVEKIDPITLNIIQEYYSISEAALDMNVTHSAIKRAVEGQNQSCQGYFWRYKGDIDKKFSIKEEVKKAKTKINQIDLETGQIIATYDSQADALRALNKNPKSGGISSVCRGNKKSAYGYFWQYAD